ncbi:hypothetical protein DXG01_010903 [Tephrocybe rancida]|nr:hypothetical protein DXG01_010903 [Tephrocybe rancida]
MSLDNIDFLTTFAIALKSPREGPWYGVWDWILNELLFGNLAVYPKQTTRTYPQYPLTSDIDVDSPAEIAEDDAPDETPEAEQDSDDVALEDNESLMEVDDETGDDDDDELDTGADPATPPPAFSRESTAPSPPDVIASSPDGVPYGITSPVRRYYRRRASTPS